MGLFKQEPEQEQQVAPPKPVAKPHRVQRKVVVGAAHDPEELEADRLADEVVSAIQTNGSEQRPDGEWMARSMAPRIRRATAPGGTIGLDGGPVDDGFERQLSSAGSGRPMEASTKSSMESAFGADFSGVRIHEGPKATELNRQVSAKAFTLGSDIFFSGKAPSGNDKGGQKLLAHELTHTLQQGGAARMKRTVRRSPVSANGPRWTAPEPAFVPSR